MTTKFQQLQNNAHFYSIQTLKPHLINPASAYFFSPSYLKLSLEQVYCYQQVLLFLLAFLSPPKRTERPLCRRVAGEKEKVRKGRWEGEREEAPFRSSHHPPRVCYFSIIAIFWDTELESLRKREGVPHFCSVNFVFL